MKKVIGTILIIIGIVLVVFILLNGTFDKPVENKDYTIISEDGIKKNNSEQFNKTKKYKSIEFSNINFEYRQNVSILTLDCKNTSDQDFEEEIVIVSLLDENEESIQTLIITVPDLKPNESVTVSSAIDMDVVNVYDFEVFN